MTTGQGIILLILLATIIMFMWGRWRHDMVALGALLACVLAGLLAPELAFSGFAHPAVITVACVLVLSRGLFSSGAVDVLVRYTLPSNAGPVFSLVALTGLGAFLSSFMNNVGAMALLMPIAIQLARRLDMPPGRFLMPLAFGTILGGMTTLIGTPPNLIVSSFRVREGVDGFGMFDFTPIGLSVSVIGIVFLALIGWRLVPARKKQAEDDFETGAYFTEVRVPEKSKANGMTLGEIESALAETGAQIIALVRNEFRINAPNPNRKVMADDILVIEADVNALTDVLSSLGLKLEEQGSSTPEEEKIRNSNATEKEKKEDEDDKDKSSASDDIVLKELVVRTESTIAGRSASDLNLRTRYRLNLLAISREGQQIRARLRTLKLKPGDVLLMQGSADVLAEFASETGCLPLAKRELRLPDKRKALTASGIMLAAIALAALGILPVAISFALGVLASMAVMTVPPKDVYNAIDWPVIILLGALIPVAGVMEATGTADLIAQTLLDYLAGDNAILALILVLIITMFLSDLMNNAATAAVMCPIALGVASMLGVNPDTFLMAVAIGASCAFLTPIGHQNNTLILGPGGFRFGDYWRMGLPLEILVVAVSVPLLLVVWPL